MEEILELHAYSCGWKAWWRCGSGSASGRHQGIEVHLDSPSTPIKSGLCSQPSLVEQERTNQRLGGIRLTEMSDAGSSVGRFRSLLLPSADNACAARIPSQTGRQHVFRVRPAEADQDPEAGMDASSAHVFSPSYA